MQNAMQRCASLCKAVPRRSTPCNAMHPCNAVQRRATPCNAVQRRATPYNAVQRCATPCNTVQRCATPCNAEQRLATVCNAMEFHFLLALKLVIKQRDWKAISPSWFYFFRYFQQGLVYFDRFTQKLYNIIETFLINHSQY